MRLITQGGILVNMEHVAYVAMRREEETEGGDRRRLLLCLPNGDSVVAAAKLTFAEAQFLRTDIAHRWAEGCPTLDIAQSLQAHADGGYYAQDAPDEPNASGVDAEGG